MWDIQISLLNRPEFVRMRTTLSDGDLTKRFFQINIERILERQRP